MIYDCRCISSKTGRDCGKTRHDDCIGLPISSVLVSGFINNEINREPFISAGQHSLVSVELARRWNVTLITQHADDTKWRSCLFPFSLFFFFPSFFYVRQTSEDIVRNRDSQNENINKTIICVASVRKKEFEKYFSPEKLRVYTGFNRGFYWKIIQTQRFRISFFSFRKLTCRTKCGIKISRMTMNELFAITSQRHVRINVSLAPIVTITFCEGYNRFRHPICSFDQK